MKKSIVVLSPNDPYILMRLFTELQMEGFANDRMWNDKNHPFEDDEAYIKDAKREGREVFTYALQVCRNLDLCFHCHDCQPVDISMNLTESNYSEVLQTILNERL